MAGKTYVHFPDRLEEMAHLGVVPTRANRRGQRVTSRWADSVAL